MESLKCGFIKRSKYANDYMSIRAGISYTYWAGVNVHTWDLVT